MPNPIIERAARALSLRIYETETSWPECADDARAVLRAIREPSEGMREAGEYDDCSPPGTGGKYISEDDAQMVWQAMIDAALGEE
jgi:hypothetical protein